MKRRRPPNRRQRAAAFVSRPPEPPSGQLSDELIEELQAEVAVQRAAARRAEERARELEQLVAVLRVGMRDIRVDIERVAASRAWRWGHGVGRFTARLARRRLVTKGAVVRALERIERIERTVNQLPSRTGDGPVEQVTDVVSPPVVAPQHDPAAVARATPARRATLAATLRAQFGPTPEREHWPTVSIVVVSRDGPVRLARLFQGLCELTDYPSIEIVLVDNGSASALEPQVREMAGDLRLIVHRSEDNLSFSSANNVGADLAGGEVLLLLNDDVEPFAAGWLKQLVSTVAAHDKAIVGATLLHVANDPRKTKSGWIVQHRGIRFRIEAGLPRASNQDDGSDPFEAEIGNDLRCPAVTGAAMAMYRTGFAELGGFVEQYRFGTEDVDLCLTALTAGWEVICSGRTLLFHRESSTQVLVPRTETRDNRLANRRLFHQRWAPGLLRQIRTARLEGDAYWTDTPAHIGVTVSSRNPADGWGDLPTARELCEALEAKGVRLTLLERRGDHWYEQPDDLDAVIALMDPFDATRVDPAVPVLAWIRNWTHRWLERPWFDRLDVLLASSRGSIELLEATSGRTAVEFPLATNPRRFASEEVERDLAIILTANRWGDVRDIEAAVEGLDGVEVFGHGWEKVDTPPGRLNGPVGYDALPGLYARARVVLDDTAGPTLPYGAVNARVFDSLAAGALPVTNCAAGVRELFDEQFPTWTDSERLASVVADLLADETRRAELADRYRRVVLSRHTYAHRAETLIHEVAKSVAALTFCIKIGAPDRERAQRWGDLHFARAIGRELRRRGHRFAIKTLDEWDDLNALTFDVVLTLRGLSQEHPSPGRLNVLWSISHPQDLSGTECDGFDLVAVASSTHATALSARTTTPVIVLEQATDPRIFYPDADLEMAHDVVFVGNSRGVRRRVMDWLQPTDVDVAVWGAGWDGLLDPALLMGEFIPNDELRSVYSSAKIVLNDHWDDMREAGYASNRIYDALASGAVVLSDDVAGLDDLFDGAVATYDSRDSLHREIDRLLAEPEERKERATRGRAAVLARHTFSQRVDVLLDEVETQRSRLGLGAWIHRAGHHRD